MVTYDHDHENEIVPFAETNFRNQNRRFGIKTDDRRRHMYLVGKTGMGKTTLLENLVLNDINAGHGVGIVDPHGDFAEKLLDYIPTRRVNDVVYFNPADMDYPIGFNVLEAVDERHKHLVASGMMGVFKKIWPDVWSPRMEYILNNCILALLDYPGSTMLGVNRLLVDKEYRKRVIAKIKDPVVKSFWVDEYASYQERFRTEAIAPIQNKVGQFLSTAIVRNIVAQTKSTIDPRKIMDEGKIFIMNLSKGRLGEDASRLLGGMLITKLQLAAMERVDVPEKERRDFYLYVDEFQNFATESFANILSEARKYHLNLIIAHQYIEQLDEKVRPAVFGNVGTLILFRVGGADALFLESEFTPALMATDLVNLTKYDIYLKLMIDGVASNPFSATTLSPIANLTGNHEKTIKISRERYAEKRDIIEEKITRWSGLAEGAEEEEEKEMRLPRRDESRLGPPRKEKTSFEGRRPPVIVVTAPRPNPPPADAEQVPMRQAPPPTPQPVIRREEMKKPVREARDWMRGHERPVFGTRPGGSRFGPQARGASPARPQTRPTQDQARPSSSTHDKSHTFGVDEFAKAQDKPNLGELVKPESASRAISLQELANKAKLEEKRKEDKPPIPKLPESKKDETPTEHSGQLKPGEVVRLDK